MSDSKAHGGLAAVKNWNDMVSANMNALRIAPSSLHKVPLADVSTSMAETATALALMPMGLAAGMWGTMVGAWAGAIDSAVSASRTMGTLKPAMPAFKPGVWPGVSNAKTLPFAPVKNARTAKPVQAPAAEVAADIPAAPVPEHDEPAVETATPVAPAFEAMVAASAAPIVESVADVTQVLAAKAPVATVPAERPRRTPKTGSLLDMVSGTEVAEIAPESAQIAAPAEAADAGEIAPEDFKRPAGIKKPKAVDDLKLISGVGPKIEGILHSLGIYTFAQIAAWTAQEIAWVDDYLSFKGRITRDGWLAQAAALAEGGMEEYVKRFGKAPR
jgi:predicted flap endonuclease-1-like 5' DNA nuclease